MDHYNKIKRFCAFQERCHSEVREKLYSYGLFRKEVDMITVQLIEEGCLSEERFGMQFAGGKFRIKKWGRIKIKYALKQKGVSERIISDALDSLPEGEYLKTLDQLAAKKWQLLKKEPTLTRKPKTVQYLIQKGFEKYLAIAAVDKAAGKHRP